MYNIITQLAAEFGHSLAACMICAAESSLIDAIWLYLAFTVPFPSFPQPLATHNSGEFIV